MVRLISQGLSFLSSFLLQSFAGNEAAQSDESEPPSNERAQPEEQRSFNLLAIGLNEKNKFGGGRAKLRNFEPSTIEGRLELSSFSLDGLEEQGRWDVLDQHSNKAPIPARAEFEAGAVAAAGLGLDPDWEPERHVNIIDWPSEEQLQKDCQQVLFAAHNLIRR